MPRGLRADQSDVGLQAERNALSWQRTGLSLVVVGAVLTNCAVETLDRYWSPLSVVTVLVALAAAVVGVLRYARVLAVGLQQHAIGGGVAHATMAASSALLGLAVAGGAIWA